MYDSEVLEIVVKKLTENFNELIKACVDESGKPKAPQMKDVMQARACLPKGYDMTLVKNKKKG